MSIFLRLLPLHYRGDKHNLLSSKRTHANCNRQQTAFYVGGTAISTNKYEHVATLLTLPLIRTVISKGGDFKLHAPIHGADRDGQLVSCLPSTRSLASYKGENESVLIHCIACPGYISNNIRDHGESSTNFISITGGGFCSDAAGLPSYLISCYRSNSTQNYVAQSEQVFLDLIRKVEDALPTSLDIRTLSASLFHRLRFDGVQKAVGISETEFVTPYRNNGIMAPKLELLKRLISVSGSVAFEELLSQSELCMLHKLISNSVEPFERGDETRTCPTYSTPTVDAPWITRNKMINDSWRMGYGGTTRNVVKIGRGVSKCPLELGVAQTDHYGDLSLGTLIGAIAAGLQPQTVQINELMGTYRQYQNLESMDETPRSLRLDKLFRNLNTIDNHLAAGLAGDLAEVCVYQTPFVGNKFQIGKKFNLGNFANFLTLHSHRYTKHVERHDFSEIEFAGGRARGALGVHRGGDSLGIGQFLYWQTHSGVGEPVATPSLVAGGRDVLQYAGNSCAGD